MKWLLQILTAIITAIMQGLHKSPEERAEARQVKAEADYNKAHSAWAKELDRLKREAQEKHNAYDEYRAKWHSDMGLCNAIPLHDFWMRAEQAVSDYREREPKLPAR